MEDFPQPVRIRSLVKYEFHVALKASPTRTAFPLSWLLLQKFVQVVAQGVTLKSPRESVRSHVTLGGGGVRMMWSRVSAQ